MALAASHVQSQLDLCRALFRQPGIQVVIADGQHCGDFCEDENECDVGDWLLCLKGHAAPSAEAAPLPGDCKSHPVLRHLLLEEAVAKTLSAVAEDPKGNRAFIGVVDAASEDGRTSNKVIIDLRTFLLPPDGSETSWRRGVSGLMAPSGTSCFTVLCSQPQQRSDGKQPWPTEAEFLEARRTFSKLHSALAYLLGACSPALGPDASPKRFLAPPRKKPCQPLGFRVLLFEQETLSSAPMEAVGIPSAIVELHPREVALDLEPGIYCGTWQHQGVLLAVKRSCGSEASAELTMFDRSSVGFSPVPACLSCGRVDELRWLRPFSHRAHGQGLSLLVRTDVAMAASLLWPSPVVATRRPQVPQPQKQRVSLPCHLLIELILQFAASAEELPAWVMVNGSFARAGKRLLPAALRRHCVTRAGKEESVLPRLLGGGSTP